jgi:hypothetical protein
VDEAATTEEGHRERPGRGVGAGTSPRHRDAPPGLAGKLLAALPPESWGRGLPTGLAVPALGRLGLTAGEGEALGILPALRRLAPALAAHAVGWIWRCAVPVRLDLGEVVVEDTLALLLEGAEGRRALALVPGPPGTEGTPVTESVLLAALGGAPGVQVAAVPLEGGAPEVSWTGVARLGREALGAAAASALHPREALPPVLPAERCTDLGCGFLARCHGGTRGL